MSSSTGLFTWPLRVVTAVCWYAWAFVRANVSVTWDIITPSHLSDPSVVRYDTRCRTEWEVALLSVLITLTPGTMVLTTEETTAAGDAEVRLGPGSRTFRIYVHSMFETDPEVVRSETATMEAHMLSATRPLDGAPSAEARA